MYRLCGKTKHVYLHLVLVSASIFVIYRYTVFAHWSVDLFSRIPYVEVPSRLGVSLAAAAVYWLETHEFSSFGTQQN